MIGTEPLVESMLRARLPGQSPEERAALLDEIRILGEEIRFLPWADRARILAVRCWQEAQERLSTEQVTAVIHRQPDVLLHCAEVRSWAERVSLLLAGCVLLVEEARPSEEAPAVLTYLLTGHDPCLCAAMRWIEARGAAGLREWMVRLPGFAFLFLILYPNDSAESFMARDAFWEAMLGG